MQRGIELLAAAYEPEHRDVVLAKGQLGQALLDVGRKKDAAELLGWVLGQAESQEFDAKTISEYADALVAATSGR